VVGAIMEGGDILEPLRDRIVGRVAQDDVYDPLTARRSFRRTRRSPRTREPDPGSGYRAGEDPLGAHLRDAPRSLPALLRPQPRQRPLVEIGEAVGVIAASRSASRAPSSRCVPSTSAARHPAFPSSPSTRRRTPGNVVQLVNVNTVTNKDGNLVVVNRNGKLLIMEVQQRRSTFGRPARRSATRWSTARP
jgi:DNA-directed RNA polymerase subunit beta'